MAEKKSTILVVDDDLHNLKLVDKILSSAGYDVSTCTNGAGLIEMARDNPPDLFIMDIMMPEINGLEVCRVLKSEEMLKQIPIIFLTAKDGAKDIVEGFEAGASDYITKPIKRSEMLARVKTHIKLYHSILELERLNRLALDASPSTGLPGNNTIAEAISDAIEQNNDVCVIYTDLDNFKAYNDKYGFAKGDRAIKYTAQVLVKSVEATSPDSFLGHIGGDDFTLIVPSEKAKAVSDEIVRRFDEGIRDFYDPEDTDAGFIMSLDRQGKRQKFPIMSISVAGVHLANRGFKHYLEVANVCADVKKRAKGMSGSVACFDRRGKSVRAG